MVRARWTNYILSCISQHADKSTTNSSRDCNKIYYWSFLTIYFRESRFTDLRESRFTEVDRQLYKILITIKDDNYILIIEEFWLQLHPSTFKNWSRNEHDEKNNYVY